MVTTSDRPITVDGVRLDTLGWNVEAINRGTAATRSADVTVPGRDGAIASLNDDLEPANLGLEMFVNGTDADGVVPAAGRRDTMRANLDELVHLFGVRHRLLEVIQQTGPGTEAREYIYDVGVATAPGGAWLSNMSGAAVGTSGSATGIRAPIPAAGGSTPYITTPTVPLDGYTQGTPVNIRVTAAYEGVAGSTGSLRAEVRWRDAANALVGTAARLDGFLPNGGLTTVRLNVVPPPGAVSYAAIIFPVGGWLAGEAIFLDTWSMNDAVDLTLFTGQTANGPLYTYVWTGAVNGSVAVRYPTQRRRALAKVVDAITPEVNAPGSSGRFAVGLVIPSGAWEDPYAADWDGATGVVTNGITQEVTTLQGGVGRIQDAILAFKGPATAPRITDASTGAYVALGRNLSSAETWRVNVGTWSSRVGALTVASADTDGTDVVALTTHGGTPNQAAYLPLTTVRDRGFRRVNVISAGQGSSASRLSIRARRKWAL